MSDGGANHWNLTERFRAPNGSMTARRSPAAKSNCTPGPSGAKIMKPVYLDSLDNSTTTLVCRLTPRQSRKGQIGQSASMQKKRKKRKYWFGFLILIWILHWRSECRSLAHNCTPASPPLRFGFWERGNRNFKTRWKIQCGRCWRVRRWRWWRCWRRCRTGQSLGS